MYQMDIERGDVATLNIRGMTCGTFLLQFLNKIKIHTVKFIKAERTSHNKLCQNIIDIL